VHGMLGWVWKGHFWLFWNLVGFQITNSPYPAAGLHKFILQVLVSTSILSRAEWFSKATDKNERHISLTEYAKFWKNVITMTNVKMWITQMSDQSVLHAWDTCCEFCGRKKEDFKNLKRWILCVKRKRSLLIRV